MENTEEREPHKVARLKPVQSNPVVIPDQSDYTTEEEFFQACKKRRGLLKRDIDAESMTDAEMNEALDALKDPKGRQDQGAGAGQCGSDAADGVRYT